MKEGNQVLGHALLVVLGVMVAVLVISIVKPSGPSEEASPREPVITETVPVREIGVTVPEDTHGEYVWEGTM